MKKLILIMGIALMPSAFAQDQDVINFGQNIEEGVAYCRANPGILAMTSFKIRAGYVHTWLAGFVSDLKESYTDLEIQDSWAYGVFSRRVEIAIKGECGRVIEAGIAIEDYLSGASSK